MLVRHLSSSEIIFSNLLRIKRAYYHFHAGNGWEFYGHFCQKVDLVTEKGLNLQLFRK